MDSSGSISGEYFGSPLLLITLSIINVPTFGVVVAMFVIGLLICCSAIMSASEIAFFSITAQEKDELADSDSISEKRIARLLNKSKYLLSTILIANNLVNIGTIVVSYYIVTNLFNFKEAPFGLEKILEFLVNIIIVTFFLVLFGEAIPKVYAANNKIPLAKRTGGLLFTLNRLLYPINYVLVNSTSVIEKRIKKHSSEIDIEEINKAIDITVENKTSKNEVQMLKGIVQFGNITVKQIMRPRLNVAAADVEWDYETLLNYVKENGYSRLPVYKETIDDIHGVLYIKDLLEHINQKKDFGWQKLIREALHTPETKKIDDLMREFQSSKKHLAVVVDEFGGTSGIVTLEDIVEEIIGDIKDESDESADSLLRKNADGTYIAEGMTTLSDLEKALGLEIGYFEEHKGDAETLAGMLLEMFGRIPKSGEEIPCRNFKFKVLSFTKNRIDKVKIIPQ